MAMVHEIMTFPLKPNGTPPMMLNPIELSTPPAIQRPIVSTNTPYIRQTTLKQRPSQPSISLPAPSKPSNDGITDSIQSFPTQITTKQPHTGVGQRTIIQEGDFEINSRNESDRFSNNEQIILTNQPIFISSLGELSTDVGNKFDINKSNIIKPDQNEPITSTPILIQSDDQLHKSLVDSFQNRQNDNMATPTTSDNNLFRGLQQVLQQNPDAISGEADLIEFIRQILQRNPHLTADQLNGILSSESDAILTIVNNTLKQNRNSLSRKSDKTQLLDSIQDILNKYKSNAIVNENQTPAEAIFSGEGDLLSQTIQRIVAQSQIPIFTGEADLLQFIELIKQQNSDLTSDQISAIISSNANSIIQFLKETKQKNSVIGSADLLEAIQQTIQKNKNNSSQRTQSLSSQAPFISLPQNLPTAQIDSNLDKSEFNAPTSQHQQQSSPTTTTSPQLVIQSNNQSESSLNHNFTNSMANHNQNVENVIKPILNFGTEAIESGEADLVQIIQQIIMRLPNQRLPIFSGEADLLQFIELVKQQNTDLSVKQLAIIIGGEVNSILRILNNKAQQKQVNGFPLNSGEADLLEAIQLVINKYRQNNQASPPLPEPIFSGEMELLFNIQRIQQRISVPILSGEADLLQFIRRIQQRYPNLTPAQLNEIISGEMDAILRIFNGKRQENAGLDVIESGEADLLEAIQIVIDKAISQSTNQPSSVQSSDSLFQAIQQINQNSVIPIFSGEADLVQFIERLLQQNPNLTKEQISDIISRENALILELVNQMGQRSGTVAIESGEAILLEAIQIVLEKYKDFTPAQTITEQTNLIQTLRQIKQQSPVPLFSTESDILQFSQRLQQRNPTISLNQLNSIISREIPSILTYLTEKQGHDRFNNFTDYSGDDDLLVAVQYYVEQYAKPDTGEIVAPPPKLNPIHTEDGLPQTLQKIQQQTSIPIFSGEADLVQFIELVKQRNPDFTSDQLTAIISGEADSILQILNGKVQTNQSNGISVQSGSSNLLEAIQLVIQKYRSKSVPSPTLSQIVSTQPQAILQQQSVPIHSDESDLIQTLKFIQNQTSIPIYSGEADLLQFIELIKQRYPEFTANQLNAILAGEGNLISQILNEKAQRNQYTGIAVISGESDLLEAIEIVIQRYRGRPVPDSIIPPNVSNQFAHVPTPEMATVQPVQTIRKEQSNGISNLLQTIRNIEEQSTVPIFSGEEDLVQFIELIKKRRPELSTNQLNTIISNAADSILQILNEKRQNSGVSSTNIDLLDAISQVLNKYNGNSQRTSGTLSTEYGPPIRPQSPTSTHIPQSNVCVNKEKNSIICSQYSKCLSFFFLIFIAIPNSKSTIETTSKAKQFTNISTWSSSNCYIWTK